MTGREILREAAKRIGEGGDRILSFRLFAIAERITDEYRRTEDGHLPDEVLYVLDRIDAEVCDAP